MKKNAIGFFLIFLIVGTGFYAKAQDTLPKFSVKEIAKGKVIVSWVNPFANCIQLMVQRSYDSTRFFTSIFSAQSPNLPQNGFADNEVAPGVKAFYRVFYVLDGGDYFFTKSISTRTSGSYYDDDDIITKLGQGKYITVYKQTKDTILRRIEAPFYKKFKDSIATKTSDTLYFFSIDEVIWRPYTSKPLWKPSVYIFSDANTYITVYLPQFKLHKYHIKFFEEDGKDLFEIKQMKEDKLILDKTNFIHSGWFYFELYEDEKLKEKGKVYLVKDY